MTSPPDGVRHRFELFARVPCSVDQNIWLHDNLPRFGSAPRNLLLIRTLRDAIRSSRGPKWQIRAELILFEFFVAL